MDHGKENDNDILINRKGEGERAREGARISCGFWGTGDWEPGGGGAGQIREFLAPSKERPSAERSWDRILASFLFTPCPSSAVHRGGKDKKVCWRKDRRKWQFARPWPRPRRFCFLRVGVLGISVSPRKKKQGESTVHTSVMTRDSARETCGHVSETQCLSETFCLQHSKVLVNGLSAGSASMLGVPNRRHRDLLMKHLCRLRELLVVDTYLG